VCPSLPDDERTGLARIEWASSSAQQESPKRLRPSYRAFRRPRCRLRFTASHLASALRFREVHPRAMGPTPQP